MSYELFIAKRYLKSKRKTGFISLITYISIIGVMIGVAAVIIVLSIMNGFESEVRSRIIGFGAHIELRTYHDQGVENYHDVLDKIKNVDHITGISPYINEKALIISKKKKQGVAIKAVDAATVDRVSDIRQNVKAGVFEVGSIEVSAGKSYPGVVLGTYLANKLNVGPGDIVQILSPAGITPLLSAIPHLRTFKVTGLFETGIFEFDELFAYMSIKDAQLLFGLKQKVSGLEIKLDDMNNAELVAMQLRNILEYPYAAITWFDMNKNLFSWMRIQKLAMSVILSIIFWVAVFNIVSTLIMIVLEKTKEIGILKSMGASSKGIMKIFVFEGLLGGVVGTMLGCIIAFVVCWLQMEYKIISLPPDVYIISALPVLMRGFDFAIIAACAILFCCGATLYPAWKAAYLDPVEAIRYE